VPHSDARDFSRASRSFLLATLSFAWGVRKIAGRNNVVPVKDGPRFMTAVLIAMRSLTPARTLFLDGENRVPGRLEPADSGRPATI